MLKMNFYALSLPVGVGLLTHFFPTIPLFTIHITIGILTIVVGFYFLSKSEYYGGLMWYVTGCAINSLIIADSLAVVMLFACMSGFVCWAVHKKLNVSLQRGLMFGGVQFGLVCVLFKLLMAPGSVGQLALQVLDAMVH